MGYFKKALKKLDILDIGLIKSASAAMALFVVTIWPAAMTWIQSINPLYFLIVAIILAARPLYRAYLK